MNISKENLLALLDEFGTNLFISPESGHVFSRQIESKLDDIDYVKNNLDNPFTEYIEDNGKRVIETLYDFIRKMVWCLDIRIGIENELGLSKDVSIRLPKKKEIDVSWVWYKVNKAQDITSQNISSLGGKLLDTLGFEMHGLNIYPTSFGVSIGYLLNNNADLDAKRITDFLNKNSIKYKEIYSLGHYRIWVMISKEKSNLDKLKDAINDRSDSYSHKHNKQEGVKLMRTLKRNVNENHRLDLDSPISREIFRGSFGH